VGLAHRICTGPQLSAVQSWEEICPFGQSRSAWAGAAVSSAAAIPRIPTNQRTDTNERITQCYGLTVNVWLLSASWCSPPTGNGWFGHPSDARAATGCARGGCSWEASRARAVGIRRGAVSAAGSHTARRSPRDAASSVAQWLFSTFRLALAGQWFRSAVCDNCQFMGHELSTGSMLSP
jgi:hypothetical protein